MDFNLPNQLKDKSLRVNFLFYSALVLLMIAIFCYGIFWLKTYLQNQKIGELDKQISEYGTDQEKLYEKEVLGHKKTIDDFAAIISSNVFVFIEENTLPSIWFSNFDMSKSTNEIKLSGESASMEILSQQVQIFENKKEHVKSISVLESETGANGKIKFILNLSLNPNIFTYGNK